MWSQCLDQRERWRSISYILLEWIIQSLSHAAVNHTPKGGLLQCAQEHSDPRGAGYLSTPADQSLPANRLTPSPSTFHSSALVWKGMCGVWTCVRVCACGEVVCGGEPPFALEPWWPLRSPSHSGGCSWPPLSLNQSATLSLVALITLHVPCPFNLATKGRQAGEDRE